MSEKINPESMNDTGSNRLATSFNWLPLSIRQSNILNCHNLEQLATVSELPFINPAFEDDRLKNIIQYYSINPDEMERELHIYAKELLEADKVNDAWQVLLSATA